MMIKDTDLTTIEEITARLESIDRQREKLNSVWNPRDFEKHHTKISKLTARYEALWIVRATKLKEIIK